MPDALLLVDKPAGWTSHDVVARCRRLCATRRVGHAGTLDPLATGLLVLGVDRGTRLLTYLVGCDKAYEATIRLGQSTVTDDAEGEVTGSYAVHHLRDSAVAAAVAGLTGAISQVPSAVSAIRVDGRRAYARVRQGEQVRLPPRQVTVHRFDVLASRPVRLPGGDAVWDLDVSVEVSSGTYVRALARDLGEVLGVGGHLTALRRTRVGSFAVEQAPSLDALAGLSPPLGVPPLLPLAVAARQHFPMRELNAQEARAVAQGQRINSGAAQPGRNDSEEVAAYRAATDAAQAAYAPAAVAAYAPDGTLVALLEHRGGLAKPAVVLAPGWGSGDGAARG